ncbi:RT0821/Lpp0805 family surface protein [Rhodospirillaceae bacterium SYSU D60014]|uniref:RT0821/Lpp0805 family surface protein n=1 Tax=Virgifigura deserti TaxID=2268457 RepID=UPI000E66B4D6
MRLIHSALVAVLVIALGGCSTSHYGSKESGGTLLGAVAGGLAGSQIGGGRGKLIATGVGTLLGAFIGNEVGRSLDRADRIYATQAASTAFESYPDGRSVRWQNPNSGNSGYVVPTRTYEAAPGRYCREYQTSIVVGGRTETGYGTACRQPDGSWQVES